MSDDQPGARGGEARLGRARVTAFIATIRDLAARGVTFERYPGLEQDDFGLWSAPSGARIAWFRRPHGNLLSLAEYAR